MSDSSTARAAGSGGRGHERPARLLHPVDSVVALAILLFCALAFYQTTQFEEVSFMLTQNVPPELFPQLLIIIVAVLALGLPFEHILLERRGKDIDSARRDPVRRISWLTMALLVAVAAMAPVLGTLLTMVAICLLLPLLWGERRLRYVVPFAVLFPGTVTFLFNQVLGVYFEPGVLGLNFY